MRRPRPCAPASTTSARQRSRSRSSAATPSGSAGSSRLPELRRLPRRRCHRRDLPAVARDRLGVRRRRARARPDPAGAALRLLGGRRPRRDRRRAAAGRQAAPARRPRAASDRCRQGLRRTTSPSSSRSTARSRSSHSASCCSAGRSPTSGSAQGAASETPVAARSGSRWWPRRRRARSTRRSFRWERTLEPDGRPRRRSSRTGRSTSTRDRVQRPRACSMRTAAGSVAPRSLRGDERLQAAQVLNSGRRERGRRAARLRTRTRGARPDPARRAPEPFVGRARSLGSDDRRTFTLLSSTAIYDVRGAKRAVSTVVVFPRSDFRYYRIRATGVSRSPRCDRGGVDRCRSAGRRAAVVVVRQEERQRCRRRRRLPRRPGARARFASSTPAFDRPVEVAGSMDGGGFYPSPARGRLYRFGGGRVAPCRSTAATATCASDRERRRRAVARPAATLRAYRDDVLLAPGYAPPYRVLYGGPAVAAGVRLRATARGRGRPRSSELGPERPNEAFEPPADTRPSPSGIPG